MAFRKGGLTLTDEQSVCEWRSVCDLTAPWWRLTLRVHDTVFHVTRSTVQMRENDITVRLWRLTLLHCSVTLFLKWRAVHVQMTEFDLNCSCIYIYIYLSQTLLWEVIYIIVFGYTDKCAPCHLKLTQFFFFTQLGEHLYILFHAYPWRGDISKTYSKLHLVTLNIKRIVEWLASTHAVYPGRCRWNWLTAICSFQRRI